MFSQLLHRRLLGSRNPFHLSGETWTYPAHQENPFTNTFLNSGGTKAALRNMTHTLAMEWAPHGIRVNSISPGFVRTQMTAKIEAAPDFQTKMKVSPESISIKFMVAGTWFKEDKREIERLSRKNQELTVVK
jgi:NAD(P)-dependent dehydrogenase (short-subunit alcohol dehydrogenase family)